MKKTFVLLMALLCLSLSHAQELEIRLDPQSKPIKIFNKIRLQAIIHNTSDQPIRLFRNSFPEYGGVMKAWAETINGEKETLKAWGLDTNSGYRENSFVLLQPGKSYSIAVCNIELKQAGRYRYDFVFQQNPNTMNPKWAESPKARELGKQITSMKLAGQMTFEVAAAEQKTLNLTSISYEELKRKKVFNNLDEAKSNPSEVFRFSYTTRERTDIQGDLEAIATLKNLQSLELQFENNDVRLPVGIGKLPLMVLKINGFGKKVELPAQFLETSSLRVFRVFNVKMALPPSLAVHKDLEELAFSRVEIAAVPSWVGDLKNLRNLVLSENEIAELPDFMNKLTSLEKIWIEKTKIQRLENIFNNRGMKEIEVRQGQVNYISPKIGQLKVCDQLRLNRNQLTSIPVEIYQMSNLDDLRMEHNQISEIPPGIEQLSKLYYFSITNNQVTNFPVGLSTLPRLRYLYARRNPLKKDKAYKALKRKLSEKGMKFSVD